MQLRELTQQKRREKRNYPVGKLRSVALTVAGAPQGPSDRTLAGLGLVDLPTALHFDCETKKEMCADCTSPNRGSPAGAGCTT